ncbi:response regulator, partial [Escherichia coli]|uniref:response regulator n=3 Tax=Pseudomonadota TaxID=1224 RepID=UPI0013D2D497
FDRMLPGMDGLSMLGALRERGMRTPAIMLSALGTVDDKVGGLAAGADDYLAKPFSFAELRARIAALLRRA